MQAHEVFIAALMHDIGHIGLSDVILAKPVSKLNPEEATRYRLHPIFGEQALLGLDYMQRWPACSGPTMSATMGEVFPMG